MWGFNHMQTTEQVVKHVFGFGWLLDPFGIGAVRKAKEKDAAALDALLGKEEEFDPYGERGDAPDEDALLGKEVDQAMIDLGYNKDGEVKDV
jgi:hypothetical protein